MDIISDLIRLGSYQSLPKSANEELKRIIHLHLKSASNYLKTLPVYKNDRHNYTIEDIITHKISATSSEFVRASHKRPLKAMDFLEHPPKKPSPSINKS